MSKDNYIDLGQGKIHLEKIRHLNGGGRWGWGNLGESGMSLSPGLYFRIWGLWSLNTIPGALGGVCAWHTVSRRYIS